MSTSSKRQGFCSRCGHAQDGHEHEMYSRCRLCGEQFEICQVGIHGKDSGGWHLCFVPCYCGKDYYPDKATAATPLKPHEHVPTHPAYRPFKGKGSYNFTMTGRHSDNGEQEEEEEEEKPRMTWREYDMARMLEAEKAAAVDSSHTVQQGTAVNERQHAQFA